MRRGVVTAKGKKTKERQKRKKSGIMWIKRKLKLETGSRKKKRIRLFKYIGETGKSGFERNREHLRDRENGKLHPICSNM